MRNLAILFALLTAAISTAIAQSRPSEQAATPFRADDRAGAKPQTISVANFRYGNVIGYLGEPLGTVVRVTGKAVDGDLMGKRYVGKTLLEIHTINGKKVEESILFDFGRASASVAKPSPGESFDYYAHEYGEFDGVVEPPEELGIESVKVAHDGFHYRHAITIHKSNH